MKVKINNFEDYEITDKGVVISNKYNKQRILKPRINHKGYLTVILCNGNKLKTMSIHRLVGENLLKKDSKRFLINHKDGNKLNNNIENLEWCTAKENTQHAISLGLFNYYNNFGKNKRAVIDVKTKIIYKSITEASNQINMTSSSLHRCLVGKRKNNTSFILLQEYNALVV